MNHNNEPPFYPIDLNFIHSREGRIIRILAEYQETKTRLEKLNINNIIVFFGSARIKDPEIANQLYKGAIAENKNIEKYKNMVEISKYYDLARKLSYKLAKWSENVNNKDKFYLCSGGGGGIMEACNRGAHDANQKNIGFNIVLPFEQDSNPYISKDMLFYFNYFFIRKFWFSYLAKAFIVFPGGYGTLDEIFEILTLAQTRKMKKKIPIVIFGKEFFSDLLNNNKMLKYSLVSENDQDLFITTDSIEEAFEYVVSGITEWIN